MRVNHHLVVHTYGVEFQTGEVRFYVGKQLTWVTLDDDQYEAFKNAINNPEEMGIQQLVKTT